MRDSKNNIVFNSEVETMGDNYRRDMVIDSIISDTSMNDDKANYNTQFHYH